VPNAEAGGHNAGAAMSWASTSPAARARLASTPQHGLRRRPGRKRKGRNEKRWCYLEEGESIETLGGAAGEDGGV